MHEEQVKDRRIQKTKSLLHEAPGSLIREKPYDAIIVQEILDRANVGERFICILATRTVSLLAA